MKGFRYIPGVTTLELDGSLCNGCGMCSMVCPHGVLTITDGRARVVDADACIECGACSVNCETKAVNVRRGVGCADAVVNAWLRRLLPLRPAKRNSGCC